MCDTCGCKDNEGYSMTMPGKESYFRHHHETVRNHDHPHNYNHTHEHGHDHDHGSSRRIEIEKDALYENNLIAQRNRGFFEAKNILALNIVSSPGSGKTSLLEKTINTLKGEITFAVIEGDQQTTNDADRINATGIPVVQINTGSGCHLNADMINAATKSLNISNNSVLMIENVGNLICPALFDLGEKYRVILVSVTEGEDKPLKYPYMFQTSNLCIINKTDLLPYLDFDIGKLKNYALQVNHHMKFIELSVKSGDGFLEWIDWIKLKTSA